MSKNRKWQKLSQKNVNCDDNEILASGRQKNNFTFVIVIFNILSKFRFKNI